MNRQVVTGILLNRINFGDADRIITIITPDFGKLKLIARGVRKIKSKLAGGIELFSVSSITFIPGKNDIGTLVSSRLQTYYSNIVKDIDRTMSGYEVIKLVNSMTPDNCEADYYYMLEKALRYLNDKYIDLDLIKIWYLTHILKISGNIPNLATDIKGKKLLANKKYQFDYQEMVFFESDNGIYSPNHIKLLRLLLSSKFEEVHNINYSHQIVVDLYKLLVQVVAVVP